MFLTAQEDAAGNIRIAGCRVDMGTFETGSVAIEAPGPPALDTDLVPRSRFLTFVPGESAALSAIRVKLDSMHHVVPPYTGGPSVPFDPFEGQSRWVGPPAQYLESGASQIPFMASRLQCDPHFRDWSTVGLLHVTGDAIVPSSSYSVAAIAQSTYDSCSELDEGFFTRPLALSTARWGDVVTPQNPPSATAQPDIADVSALVNKFRNAPGAPIKSRALLAGEPGNAHGEITPAVLAVDFGFSHISACVDGFRGVPYPYQNLANPTDLTYGPAWCPCTDEANIRADLNGDGFIDEQDDQIEGTTALYFAVNSDDDDGNEQEDYLDDGPIFNEDDLVELRLFSKCPPADQPNAWWAVSWSDPNLKVWEQPDKSTGQLVNGASNFSWPPPRSIWLEATQSSDDWQQISFAFDNHSYPTDQAQANRQSPLVAILHVLYPCTFRYMYAQKSVLADDLPQTSGLIGGQVRLRTLSTTLCGEGFAEHDAHSAAYVSIGVNIIPNASSDGRWSQTGYIAVRLPDEIDVFRTIYAENNAGPYDFDYVLRFGPDPPPGDHQYTTYLERASGMWLYFSESEGSSWTEINHPYWVERLGERIGWATEILNKEDHLLGTATSRMQLNECTYINQDTLYRRVDFTNPAILTRNDDPAVFGMQELGFDSFEVWDKRP